MEPWLKDEVQFYEHQITGVRQMMTMRNFLLADDMGLGKSLQAITVAAGDVIRGWAEKIIIVCPITLKGNWSDEFDKFTGMPHMILGQSIDPKNPERLKALTPAKRAIQLDEFASMRGPRALIVNYEQIAKHITDLNRIGFNIAVFDEAHYLKNPQAQRTKACHKLRADRFFMLTGTPMLNQVHELWGLLHLIDPIGYPKFWTFKNRYCNTPDAPVWMSDGTFKPIAKIKVGDKVMGWKENSAGRRTLCESVVEGVMSREASEIIEATLESGKKIKCTPDHVWLSGNHNQSTPWVQIGKQFLPTGQYRNRLGTLSKVVEPVCDVEDLASEIQREAAWLGGIYDGEASRYFIAQSKSHNYAVHKRIGDALEMLDIPFTEKEDGYAIRGGRQSYVKLLNWCQISRKQWLVNQIHTQLNRTKDRVVDVKQIGSGEVVSMQTSTGNYIAWGYASKNCVFGGFQDKQVIGVKNEKELQERLNLVMIRRLKKNVLDLPEVQPIIKKLDLSDKQKKLYDQVVSELEIPIAGQADPSEIENALTKLLRLKQICGTTLAFTGEDDSAKLDVAVEDAMEILSNGHRLVVFTQFRDVQEAFCTRLDKTMPDIPIWELNGDVPQHDRQPYVKEWGAHPKAGAMVCMLQVAGVGLNMTAARHGMFLDKLWTPGMNQQAVDRLHRIGQSETQPVQILEYHMKGTVETRVEQVLKTKSKLFGTIVNDSDFKQKLLAALQGKL